MSVLAWFTHPGPSGFGYASTAMQVTHGVDLSDRHILITGVNSGLGFEMARVLAKRGARIFGVARSLSKARTAVALLEGRHHVPLVCELAEPGEVVACAERVREHGQRLDAIVCNAGVMALPELRQAHGYELHFLTNHVSHFVLVTALLDRLTEAGRVVVVTSGSHTAAPLSGIDFNNLSGARHYSPTEAYGQSKLANILFAKELARRMEGTAMTAHAVHPGVVNTRLGRHLAPSVRMALRAAHPLVLKSVGQGAATQTYAAVHPAAGQVNGGYWSDCNLATPSVQAQDASLAKRLWTQTQQIVAQLVRYTPRSAVLAG